MLDLYDRDYVPVDEAARRLGISKARVLELVTHRVLKSAYDGPLMLVEPALIRGKTC